MPTITINASNPFAFVGSDPTIPQVIVQAIGKPADGTYAWSVAQTNRISFDNSSSDLVQLKGINPSTAPLDTTLTASYILNGQTAQANVAVTSRVFELLLQAGQVQAITQSNGFLASVTYNVETGPAKQLLQPGFSGIAVTESVSVTSATLNGVSLTAQQLSGITLFQGPGATDTNSAVGDDQRLLNNSGGPLPSGLDIILSQELFIGGFFVRNNTIEKKSPASVTITNNGPTIQ